MVSSPSQNHCSADSGDHRHEPKIQGWRSKHSLLEGTKGSSDAGHKVL
jgi:hypothetical protein